MDPDDAKNLQSYQREKKKAEFKDKLKEVAEFCNCIGEIYSKYGQYEEAIQEHTQELRISEALGDKIGEAVACRKIGECHCFLGQYELALSLQKRHLLLARECENSLEEQRAWATIGKTYFCQSESRNLITSAHASKKAEKAYTKALEVCEKVKSSVKVEEYMAMKGRLYLNIGLVYDTRGEIILSADVMRRAVAIAEKFKLLDEQYMCHSSMASMFYKSGQPTQAMRSVDLALKLAEKLRNKVGEKEIYIQKTQIFVGLGDYLAAKHCLKKAYKIKVMSDLEGKKIMKMFKCVNKMQDAAVELDTNSDAIKISELNEILADGMAELGNFSEAADYYRLSMEPIDLLTKERRADIFVSMAQTFADLRNYAEAIFYYKEELRDRQDNQEQCCRTLLNIAELEELRGSKYSVLCKIYMSAFESARKAKHVKLQIQTLMSLIALQKAFKQNEHLKETEKKLVSITRKHGISEEQVTSSEDEEDHSSNKANSSDEDNNVLTKSKGKGFKASSGNLSLSDLTLSDDESDGDKQDSEATTSRPKKSKIARRNEKGETPLHRACIDGNLKKVKALISQGHPINPRDFCGWLPLHEACNHGHIEVVKCLLDAGAWINDRGGERCGGVTPLIDAANCGNLAIVRLLVTRGASLHAKDDDGNTALDCLHAWYHRVSDTMGASDVLDYNTTERMLNTKGGQGKSPVASTANKSNSSTQPSSNSSGASFKERLSLLRQKKISKRETSHDRRRRAKGSMEATSSSDEISDKEDIPHALPKLQDTPQSGALEYRSVIESVGSSVQKRLEAEQSHSNNKDTDLNDSLAKDSLPALLNETEDVGDDWLINDVDIVKPKKKSSQVVSLFTTSSSRPRSKKRSIDEERSVSKRSTSTGKRSKLARLENLPSISSSQDSPNSEPSDNLRVVASSSKKKNAVSRPELFDDQSSSDACPVSSSTERQEAMPLTNNTRKDQNILEDNWDSDEELLSYMDYVDDSFDRNSTNVNLSQLNVPTSNVSQEESSNAPVSSENFRYVGNNKSSRLPLSKEQSSSKTSFTLDTLLLDKYGHSTPKESGQSTDNGNDSGVQGAFNRSGGTHSYSASLQQQKQQQQNNHLQINQHHLIIPQPPLQQQQHHIKHNREVPQLTTMPQSTEGQILRVKVKIAEQTLLIPIQFSDQRNTILWLCQQASQRYFNMFLVRPLLTLKMSDGSVLSPTDTISSVLVENDVLSSVVRSWDRPKLEERYLQACTLCLIEEPNKFVVPMLQDCDTSGILKLVDLGLSSRLLQPVFQALEGQRTLTELHLTGNRLTDNGIMPLVELLSGLPILKVLSLDSNGLSIEGLRTMASALKEKAASAEYGDQCLGALTWLSLGHNSLEDAASSALAGLINHLPRLTRLDLPACGFTDDLFTPVLCTALQGRKLESVCIAENQIKTEGISLLLNSLHSDCLQCLDISHTRSATDKSLLPMLESFSRAGCHLTELSLAGCHLTDSDVIAVNRLVVNMKHLTTLSISQNKNVNNKSLQKLLALSTGGPCKLESLTARGCSLTAPLGSEFLEFFKGKMCSTTPLVKLVFSCRGLKQDEINFVKEIWIGKWKERAQCKIIGVAVSLTVAENK